MSPQECWLIVDENKPPEKAGNISKHNFDKLKSMIDARNRNPKHNPDARQQKP